MLGDKSITYGLYLFDSDLRNTEDMYLRNIISEAIFYSYNFLFLLNEVKETKNKEKLKAKFREAFIEADAMRAIQFEIFSYIFLKRAGNVVECMDYSPSSDNFDYLVIDNFNIKTQVECKSFSYERGLYITAGQANSIREKMLVSHQSKLTNLLNEPLNMLCSITINVNSNIGRDDESLNDFVEKIAKALDNGSSQKNDQFEIYIEKFKDLKNIQDEFVFQDVQLKSQTIELVACTSQPEGCNSRVHLRVTSELTEGYLKKFEKTCKEAAKRQLKKDKPASIFVHFTNGFILKDSVNQKEFKRSISKIFGKNHLTNLVFVTNINIEEQKEFPYFTMQPVFLIAENRNSRFNSYFLDHVPNKKFIDLT
ncbi:hypothetical protein PS042_20625 [Escherichia albertii]|uniref:hypothetical protein n=1 Tax=Escherichia albertii TaxID=208962 RepID=UPI0011E9E495|nr:hypothetical protein [Escherichia albertii]EGM8836129.1 hypothetical protein [Escherichia albertii]EJZ9666865.1 hypothetical protein [Escherichia albertii]MCQ9001658.1 hypothetical protein [Escherichia albertii]MCQ9010990.1 hypothetical protein [Escherichia albertii]MCQ9023984.1 hypothetical protein [Escherichia albertii]